MLLLDESAGVLTAMPPQHISGTFGPMCNPHIKNKSVSTCQTPKSSKNSAVVVQLPKVRQDRLHVQLQALKICVAMLLHPLGLIAVHQSNKKKKKATLHEQKLSQGVLLDKQTFIWQTNTNPAIPSTTNIHIAYTDSVRYMYIYTTVKI